MSISQSGARGDQDFARKDKHANINEMSRMEREGARGTAMFLAEITGVKSDAARATVCPARPDRYHCVNICGGGNWPTLSRPRFVVCAPSKELGGSPKHFHSLMINIQRNKAERERTASISSADSLGSLRKWQLCIACHATQ